MELSSLYHIPITKIKTATGFKTIEVDTALLSDEIMHLLVGEGLKAIINSRMAKVGPVTKLEGKELLTAQSAALEVATQNLNDLKEGKTRHSRAKAKSTIPAAVRAEAMRLAREAIKDAVRRLGHKPSEYSDKSYTAKAKEYIEHDPAYIEQARQNIEARKTPWFKLDLNIAELDPAANKKPRSTDLPAGIVGRPSGVQTVHRQH